MALHYLGRAPFSDGGLFHFIHEGARSFVERSIDPGRKERLHSDIASALERIHGDGEARPVERLARHWRLSGKKERAAEPLEKSAEKALEVFNTGRAVEYLTQALEILEPGGPVAKAVELRMARGGAFEKRCNYPEAAEDYRAGAEIAEGLDLFGKAGTALLLEGLVLYNTGSYRKALGRFEKALVFGERIGYRELISSAYNNEGLARWRLGENEAAIDCFEKSLALCMVAGRESMAGIAHYNIGNIRLDMGRFAEAERSYRRALEIHGKSGQIEHEAVVLGNLGILAFEKGDTDEAERSYTQSLTLMLESGNRAKEAISRKNIGELVCMKGEYARAESLFGKTVDIARLLGNSLLETQGKVGAGIALREAGRYEKSLAALSAALEKAREIESRDTEAQALLELAVLYARTGASEKAIAAADSAETLVESHGFSMMRVKMLRTRGEISFAGGAPDDAAALAASEMKEAERLGRVVAQREARTRLAFCMLASGDPAGASKEAAEAARSLWAGSRLPALYVVGSAGRGGKARSALETAAATENAELRWLALAALASKEERPEKKLRLQLEAWDIVKRLHDGARRVTAGAAYINALCRKNLYKAAVETARSTGDAPAAALLEADGARFYYGKGDPA